MNEIIKIKISEIDDFKNHPYKVELGDDLNDLVESIKLNGLFVPIVVRRKEDNRYELLFGHRRKKVYEILGLEEIDAIIRKHFDLRPAGIIKMLDLRRPIYKQTAAYGHFGRNDLDLPWEKLDKVEDLKKYL